MMLAHSMLHTHMYALLCTDFLQIWTCISDEKIEHINLSMRVYEHALCCEHYVSDYDRSE